MQTNVVIDVTPSNYVVRRGRVGDAVRTLKPTLALDHFKFWTDVPTVNCYNKRSNILPR